jgi:uncharacterized protein (DUF1330 family)
VNPYDFAPGAMDELSKTVPDGQAFVLINLLRYSDWAEYPPGTGHERITGKQAYQRYSDLMLPIVTQVGGRPIWRADARPALIAPRDERWDEILLVQYPSRSAFERMIADPALESAAVHRTAAVEDSRLIAATSPQSIGRLKWWLSNVSLKARTGRWRRSGGTGRR